MKVFSTLAATAALVAFTSTVDAQRLLRSEASTNTDSTVSTDFKTLGSGSSFTPGNVEAGSNFGALDHEGSTGGNRPSGSMHGGAGRGFGGSGHGMHNVGSGDGFAHGGGDHGMGGGSFSGGNFAGPFGSRGGFGGSSFGGGNFGGSFNGNVPSIGSGEGPIQGSGETSSTTTSPVTTSSSAEM